MFAIILRRKLRVYPKDWIFINPKFVPPQNAVFVKSFSSDKSSSSDEQNQQFTVSYLINSCGLCSKDALATSKKVCIKSPENPDAVLQVLRKYGFTDAHIPKLVTRWPQALLTRPEKILVPKLDFFCSFGVPLATLAKKLSVYPLILQRSLENYLVPSYDYLKSLVQSDKRVVNFFSRAPRAFAHGWQREISSNVASLRERGVPESSIVSMAVYQPSLLLFGNDKLAKCADRAAEMGFDNRKVVFVHALQVFAHLTETTFNHKKEVYKRCGWSESDIDAAFSRNPLCMTLSEKKIVANMDFLVNEVGYKPADVAECPVLLGLSLDRRLRPRWSVLGVLKSKGLLKMTPGTNAFFKLSEEKFLKKYIVEYQEHIPRLLDFYRGKLSLFDLGLSRDEILIDAVDFWSRADQVTN